MINNARSAPWPSFLSNGENQGRAGLDMLRGLKFTRKELGTFGCPLRVVVLANLRFFALRLSQPRSRWFHENLHPDPSSCPTLVSTEGVASLEAFAQAPLARRTTPREYLGQGFLEARPEDPAVM